MAYEKTTNTITLGEDSDFLVDSGLFIINMLRTYSQKENPSKEILSDWKVIEKYLDCEGKELSKVDEQKISGAWKAYLAIGIAPSCELQPAFDSFSKQYKEAGYSFKEDTPPTKIMDVFGRLMVTKEELAVNRKHDCNEEKKQSFKEIVLSFKRNTRILIVTSVAWFAFVIFRTSDDYDLLGIELYSWDDDMFLANTILPILVAWLVVKSYKWINSGEK